MKTIVKMAAISTIVAAAGAANAGFTTVNTGSLGFGGVANGALAGGSGGGPSSEGQSEGMSIVQILNEIYGNGRSSINTNSNVTGTITTSLVIGGATGWTATRLHDNNNPSNGQSGSMQLATGVGANDQVWQDGIVDARAYARFAGDQQRFGWQLGATNATLGFTSGHILQTNTQGFQQDGVGALVSVGPGDFRWIRQSPNDLSQIHSSLEAENSNTDMMIAFRLTKPGELTRYILAFEDRLTGDRDFNDFVVELVVIPLPTGAAMGMAGLGLLAIRRRSAR